MSITTIPEVSATVTDATHWNDIKTGIVGDLVPRTAGVATDLAGDLGTEDYPFKKAEIASGYMDNGEIISIYDYNGLVPAPQGYMLCDGRQITEDAYDTEHGEGSWAEYIGSSVLENRYLPNLDDKYLCGETGATQDGTVALTYEGVSGNTVNFSHNHGGANNTGQEAQQNNGHVSTTGTPASGSQIGHTHTFTIASTSQNKSIRPLSVVAKAYMRII